MNTRREDANWMLQGWFKKLGYEVHILLDLFEIVYGENLVDEDQVIVREALFHLKNRLPNFRKHTLRRER